MMEPQQSPQSKAPSFLSKDECGRLFTRAASASKGGGYTRLGIDSRWTANVRWARNRVSSAGDTRDNTVTFVREVNKAAGRYTINQITEEALANGVGLAERLMTLYGELDPYPTPEFDMPHLQPNIWSEATYRLDAPARNDAVQPLIDKAEAAGMQSAGYVQIQAGGQAVLTSKGLRRYYPYTTAQYSITVRDPDGSGSGWAGVDYSDWGRIDAAKLTQIALDKCLQSRNPVRVEPGRYTAILEPQAVADLFRWVMLHINREKNENERSWPFHLEPDQSKIGLKLLDDRLTVTADVMDPDLGFVPFAMNGEPYLPAVWFDRGVLRDLAYVHQYAVTKLGDNRPLLSNRAARMSGGDTTIEEMIATTKRGVLVTRFSNIQLVDRRSLLLTGYTRDGLWLVENGKVSKAIKNFKFTDSPLFAFNNVQQLGKPQRVFHPEAPIVVPPMKVNDFSFTSLTDAV